MTNGFNIFIDTDKEQADLLLDLLKQRLSPPGLHQFMRDRIGPHVRRRIADRFIGQGDDVTGPWHPLAKATYYFRARGGYPPTGPINVRSTQMMDWLIMTPSDINHRGDTTELVHPPKTGNALTLKKIATAQMGSPKPVTPPRPVLGLNENDLDYATSELVDYLLDGLI